MEKVFKLKLEKAVLVTVHIRADLVELKTLLDLTRGRRLASSASSCPEVMLETAQILANLMYYFIKSFKFLSQ